MIKITEYRVEALNDYIAAAADLFKVGNFEQEMRFTNTCEDEHGRTADITIGWVPSISAMEVTVMTKGRGNVPFRSRMKFDIAEYTVADHDAIANEITAQVVSFIKGRLA